MNTGTFLKVLDARFKATRKVVAAIPSDRLDFKPTPEMMSARELALHLMGNYTFLESGLTKNRWDTNAFKVDGKAGSTAELVSTFDSIYQTARTNLEKVPDEAFEQRAKPFGAEQKVSTLVLAMAEHEIQHRGQMQVYLRLMGVKPVNS